MSGLLSELRDIVPPRRLTVNEAYFLAERQATTLLRRAGITEGPVPSEVIANLPFVVVAHRRPLPSSGATKWIKPRWVVLLNANEPVTRQRFSLAHEFKHVLDHFCVTTAYGRLSDAATRQRVERICDYFAGCLLIPRMWVRDAYAHGVQDVAALAELFDVSQAAMQVRLLQLGLVERTARCDTEAAFSYYRALEVAA